MTPSTRLATAGLALACCSLAWAQAAPGASAPPATKARPHIVIVEDDGVRIEEVHVRGTVRRITVQSKLGDVRPYEIHVAPPGRDPSQERGNAGRRAWSLFDF